MGNEQYITCECGYDIFLPPHLRGKIVECLMCGNEIDTSAPPKPAPVREEVESELAVEPEVTPSDFRIIDDTARDAWGRGSSSPFEDGDGPDPVFRSTAVGRVSEPEPEPEPSYNPNAFADEDEEEDAVDVNAPDPSLIRKYEGAEHTNSYQNVDESQKCPRCGNAFRGDWDKQRHGDEVICYICSNQATDTIPDRILNKEEVRENPATERGWAYSPSAEIPEGPIEEKFWLFDPESEGFRKMIWTMAAGLPLLTLLIVFTEGFEVPETSPSVNQVETLERLAGDAGPTMPQWAVMTYWVIVGITGFLGQAASFYAVLWITDRLPNFDFKRDAILITYTMVLLSVVTGFYMGIAQILAGFTTGPIWMMLLAPVTFLIMVKIVMDTLDFRIRDFLYLLFISGPVHAFLALPMSFVYAALGTLVS